MTKTLLMLLVLSFAVPTYAQQPIPAPVPAKAAVVVAKAPLKAVVKAPAKAMVVVVAKAPAAPVAAPAAPVAAPASPVAAVPAPTAPAALPLAPAAPLAAASPIASASQPAVVAPVAPGEVGVGKMLLKYAIDLFLLIALALVSVLVKVLAKKFGFEAQAAMINDVLAKATGFAEQMAVKKLKLDGKPTPSAEKMKMALDLAVKMAQEYKLGQKGAAWWEDKLEGWLGTKKVSG